MTNKRKVWLGLGAAAAVGFSVLAMAPTTSWIVRQEGRTLGEVLRVGVTRPGRIADQLGARQAEAAQLHSEDVAMQIAAAGSDIDALERLNAPYGNTPELQSAILIALSSRRMDLKGRDTDAALLSSAGAAKSARNIDDVTPETRRLWEDAATAGERLDRDNAFFPFMHAIGLFAVHSDDAAVAEIERASQMPRYDEYLREVTEARWRLADATNGIESGTIPKAALSASTLMPHYFLLRGAARLAATQAIAAEQAGRTEEGFTIRRALERFGARLRADSTWVIGNLVGSAITGIGETRPGGEPTVPVDSKISSDVRMATMAARYEQYVRRIGHPEEVAFVRHDLAARRSVIRIAQAGMASEAYSIAAMGRLLARWMVSSSLFVNLILVLLFGGLATVVCRTRTVREGLTIRASAACVLGALALCVCLSLTAGIARALAGYADDLASFNFDSAPSTNPAAQRLLAGLLLTVLAAVVPLTMTVTFAISSRRRRIPVFTGVARGFARNALPVAIVLSCLYIGTVAELGSQEARMLEEQRRISVNAGREMARITGQNWPTFAPEGAR